MRIKNRVAVITGAAGGIGRELALAMATRGADLAIVDVNSEELEATAAVARGRGAVVTTHVVDVSKAEEMEALAAAVIEAHGRVEILVNNAGVTITAGFHEHTLDDWEWVLGVNLWGVIHGIRAFLPHLLRAEQAHIVNISSLYGIVGVPGQTSYCASKYAVRGLSEALQEELLGSHIGLTVVHPGGVSTGIMKNARTAHDDLKGRLERFFEKATMPASVAAGLIVRAIERDRPRLRITREAYVMDVLKRLMPTWGNRLSVKAMVKTMRMGNTLEKSRAAAIEEARREG
jgi:NAD(P)-dependent dehydrogenase (short-subunit alcohol dehydrogenase family)